MYKEGHEKQGGREKGTENKLSGTLRDMMNNFLSDHYSKFVEDFESLKPVERTKVYTNCLQFVLPKINAINLDTGPEPIGEIKMISVRKKLVDRLTEISKEGGNGEDINNVTNRLNRNNNEN